MTGRSIGWLFVTLAALAMAPAAAFENDQPLADPALEERAMTLARELRCLVCQNQSIMESDAPLARDLRTLVRERLQAGDTDAEIRDYVVTRYGDFVLLRPPFKPHTWALWFGPLILGLVAALVVARFWAARRAAPAPAPLDAAERARLDDLIADDKDR